MERVVTSQYNFSTAEHLHRYAIAELLAKDKTVLDIACGEGYGSHLLAKQATKVYGVDINEEVIANAHQKYKVSNLAFIQGAATAIPLDAQSVDLVVSFETIEHLAEQDQMLKEIIRVLRPNGCLLLSSPDKESYSDIPNFNNPFHVKELYFKDLERLISTYFNRSTFWKQHYYSGSLIVPYGYNNFTPSFNHFSGDYSKITHIQQDVAPATYYFVLAANNIDLPTLPTHSFFDTYFWDTPALSEAAYIVNTKAYKLAKGFMRPFNLLKKAFMG